jgi:hypothetical protein
MFGGTGTPIYFCTRLGSKKVDAHASHDYC